MSRGFVPGGMVLDEIDTCITEDGSFQLQVLRTEHDMKSGDHKTSASS